MCLLVLNLNSLVSRGGRKETSVWRDVTGQNGSLMSHNVPQFLSALNVPHLVARRGRTGYLQSDVTLLLNVAAMCVSVVCVSLTLTVPSKDQERSLESFVESERKEKHRTCSL